jgi:hypothetical protein
MDGQKGHVEQTPEVDRIIVSTIPAVLGMRTSRVGRTGNSQVRPPKGITTLRDHGT